MNLQKDKYLWYTDPHFKPWTRHKFLNSILDEKPKAVFLTGDITYGPTLIWDLDYLGHRIGRPLYFVLGNHDYHGSDIETVHKKVREVCLKHKNLIWMTESGIVPINEEVALIGAEGWYDARIGNPKFINYTYDWLLTSDFKNLPTMEDRIEAFRKLADDSADKLSNLLEQAVQEYKTIYLLTHFPPWKEANRGAGTLMEKFWMPYNVNLKLGQALEKVMENYKKRNLIVLAGHTHTDCWIHVSRNIECRVNKAQYMGSKSNEEHIYI